MEANSEDRCKAVLDVVQTWLVKRGVSLNISICPTAGHRASPAREYKLDVPLGGHQPGEREEDQQDHPRRGPRGQDDPG